MSKQEIHCCIYCGRDTTSRSKICKDCIGGKEHDQPPLPDVWEAIEQQEGKEREEETDE